LFTAFGKSTLRTPEDCVSCLGIFSVEATLKGAYSRVHRVAEVSAIGLFFVLTFGLAWQLYSTLYGVSAWLVAAVSAALGYIFADLVSGIVHWMADRYGSEQTPLLGANYIRPFREHHTDPTDITRHDFIETNGSNCIISIPFMIAVLGAASLTPTLLATYLLGSMLAFSLGIFATNQFHKWAHMKDAPSPARALMRLSLILGADHHDAHHRAPYDRNYCITTGWWNPLLHPWKVFDRAERCLAFLTGARPYEEAAKSVASELEKNAEWEACQLAALRCDHR
jgi:ubiquitin-conjugating enzyme E2 variant